MIIEQHYDDEVLIDLLDEAEEDNHVPECNTCSGTLESYRDLSAALHDDSVWDARELPETPVPQTTNFLRAFAERTRAENIAAGPIVAKLVADPSSIDQHPEWRTAGVVRKLLAIVDEKNFSEPKVAADLAALAVKVADSLELTLYPGDAVMKLRATAWHELGYAYYTIGSFTDSLKAFDAADALLATCTVGEYEIANLDLHRAQVYMELERVDEGLILTNKAAETFRRYGNLRRVAVADATTATLLMVARRFEDALLIHEQIAANSTLDDHSRATALHHAAICQRELRHFGEARTLFAKAAGDFERLGDTWRRLKARWSLGNVFLREQLFAQALDVFKAVRAEAEELGMAQDVALASVDAAEALLMLGRPEEVSSLCQSAMGYFENAGLTYTRGALTALAYLQESAEARTLNAKAITQVRDFFEILPKQPHLLFAFPL